MGGPSHVDPLEILVQRWSPRHFGQVSAVKGRWWGHDLTTYRWWNIDGEAGDGAVDGEGLRTSGSHVQLQTSCWRVALSLSVSNSLR